MNDYQELLSSYVAQNNELQERGPNVSIRGSSVFVVMKILGSKRLDLVHEVHYDLVVEPMNTLIFFFFFTGMFLHSNVQY